jgi:hypothetical protein
MGFDLVEAVGIDQAERVEVGVLIEVLQIRILR